MKRMVENSEKIEEITKRVNTLPNNEMVIYDDVEIQGRLLLDSGLSVDGNSEFNGTTNYYEHATFDIGLTTSNITSPGGISFKLIDEEDYSIIDSGASMAISTINLGVAIAVTAKINASESNGEYTIMSSNNDKLNDLGIIQMSGEPVCKVIRYKDNSTNTINIKIQLNKNVAEYPVADYYRFSFILGVIGQEL